MGGYIANFTVYTLAMAGLICFAVFVYKKVMDGSFRGDGSKYLSVEESMSLTPRKTLHVVRAGNEKFLIASDVDRTTLISKLGESTPSVNVETQQMMPQFDNFMQDMQQRQIQPAQTQQPQERIPRQRVHLEPVKVKNPQTSQIRKGMDRRSGEVNVATNQGAGSTSAAVAGNSKTVELDFYTPVNHGFSTMKEMAKKINEL